VVASNLSPNPSDEYSDWSGPSDEYVRWYVSIPLHQWVVRQIGYDAYLTIWRELERAIQRVLNTPPVMAYDAVRPDLKGRIHQFLLKYDVDNADLSDQAQDALTRILDDIEDAPTKLYHRGVERELVKRFLRVGVTPGMKLRAVARQAGFTLSADGEHYSGHGMSPSRTTMSRALDAAIKLSPRRTGKTR
jgi:hypothetical protein